MEEALKLIPTWYNYIPVGPKSHLSKTKLGIGLKFCLKAYTIFKHKFDPNLYWPKKWDSAIKSMQSTRDHMHAPKEVFEERERVFHNYNSTKTSIQRK